LEEDSKLQPISYEGSSRSTTVAAIKGSIWHLVNALI